MLVLKYAQERLAEEQARHDRLWERYMKARARYMAKAGFRSSQSFADASDSVARSHHRLEEAEAKLKAAQKREAEQARRQEVWNSYGAQMARIAA